MFDWVEAGVCKFFESYARALITYCLILEVEEIVSVA